MSDKENEWIKGVRDGHTNSKSTKSQRINHRDYQFKEDPDHRYLVFSQGSEFTFFPPNGQIHNFCQSSGLQ